MPEGMKLSTEHHDSLSPNAYVKRLIIPGDLFRYVNVPNIPTHIWLSDANIQYLAARHVSLDLDVP
jgi:hypothetical protein